MAAEIKEPVIKTCFIITPIGDEGTQTRIDAEGLISAVICPVLKELGYEDNRITIPHRIGKPGYITGQIIEHLLNDTLVVANLTGLNANVMYELAVRHAVGKPTVILTVKGTPMPFDINQERTVFYTNHMAAVETIRAEFKSHVLEAEKEKEPDNPVFRVSKSIVFRQAAATEPTNQYIIERLDRIESHLSRRADGGTTAGKTEWEGKVVQGDLRSNVYYVRKGTRYYVAHWKYVEPFGLSSATMLRVKQAEIDALPEGNAIGNIDEMKRCLAR